MDKEKRYCGEDCEFYDDGKSPHCTRLHDKRLAVTSGDKCKLGIEAVFSEVGDLDDERY